eukprot:3714223-Pyramimonas_sp.AAC.1
MDLASLNFDNDDSSDSDSDNDEREGGKGGKGVEVVEERFDWSGAANITEKKKVTLVLPVRYDKNELPRATALLGSVLKNMDPEVRGPIASRERACSGHGAQSRRAREHVLVTGPNRVARGSMFWSRGPIMRTANVTVASVG